MAEPKMVSGLAAVGNRDLRCLRFTLTFDPLNILVAFDGRRMRDVRLAHATSCQSSLVTIRRQPFDDRIALRADNAVRFHGTSAVVSLVVAASSSAFGFDGSGAVSCVVCPSQGFTQSSHSFK